VVRISNWAMRGTIPQEPQYLPAWMVSPNEIVFTANKSTISGSVSLSLDGQHFDSLSVSPLVLSLPVANNPAPSGIVDVSGDNIWIFSLIGVAAVASIGFLIYAVYKYKTRDSYSSYNY